MSLYIWQSPENDTEERAISLDRRRFADPTSLKQGIAVGSKVLYFKSTATSEQLAGHRALASDIGIPVVDEPIRSVVETWARPFVQFIPAEVSTADNRVVHWFALIATKTISAVDLQRSQCLWIPRTKAIMGFKRLAILTEAIADIPIFRLAEYLPALLVSESFAQGIIEEGGSDVGLFPLGNRYPLAS